MGNILAFEKQIWFIKCHNIALSSGRRNAQGKYSEIAWP